PQAVRICCRNRHAYKRYAFQNLRPLLWCKVQFVRHGTIPATAPLSLQSGVPEWVAGSYEPKGGPSYGAAQSSPAATVSSLYRQPFRRTCHIAPKICFIWPSRSSVFMTPSYEVARVLIRRPCPLMALSRHAQCADECPLLG